MIFQIRSSSLSKKYKFIYGLFILLIIFIGADAQAQVRYRGKIKKAKNNRPVVGAKIRIDNSDELTYTDINGVFTFYAEKRDFYIVALDDKRFEPIEFSVYHDDEVLVLVEKRNKKLLSVPKSIIPLATTDEYYKTIISPGQTEISNHSNVALLLQHKVPGLTVSRPGNNPNEHFQIYNRGISSLANRHMPLIIIDGMPEMTLERLAPEDIASFAVTKNGVGGANYGLLGGAGVIEINTMQFDTSMPFVRYHSSVGRARVQQEIPIMDVGEYLEYKSKYDQGDTTDWLETITQTGISHRHHLSFMKGSERIGFYASMGFQEEEGILKQSGFIQGNARLNFHAKSKNGSTIYRSTFAFSQRDANLSNPDAFLEAIQFNPTKSIYDEDGNFTFRVENVSNIPNPLGQIQIANNLKRSREWTGSFFINKTAASRRSWEYQLSFRKRSYILGRRKPVNIFMKHNKFDRKHFFGKIQTNKQYVFDRVNITQKIGIESSILFEKHSTFFIDQQNHDNFNDFDFKAIQSPYSLWDNIHVKDFKYPKKMLSAFMQEEVRWSLFNLFGGLRYDRVYADSGKISKMFFHIGVTTDLKKIKEIKWLDKANLTLGFGKSGALHVANGYLFTSYNNYLDGEYLSPLSVGNNNTIDFKSEIDLHLDCSSFNNRLNMTLSLYHNYLYDLEFGTFEKGEIANKGLETFITYKSKSNKKTRSQTSLGFYTNISSIYRFSESNKSITLSQAMQSGAFGNIWIESYGQAGKFYGYRTDGTIANDRYVRLPDENNIVSKKVIGNTKPSVGLTLTNELKREKWDFTVKLRSLIGHYLFNNKRNYFEKNGFSEANIVNTKFFNEMRRRRQTGYTDIFLENASFLKLDYLSIGYSPRLKKGNIRIYVSGHDVLTDTSYTGVDPEPVYHQFNVVLAGGIEPLDGYFRSRQFVLGVQFSL